MRGSSRGSAAMSYAMVTFPPSCVLRSTGLHKVASAPMLGGCADGSFGHLLSERPGGPGSVCCSCRRSRFPTRARNLEGVACRSPSIRGGATWCSWPSGVSTSRSSTRGCRGSSASCDRPGLSLLRAATIGRSGRRCATSSTGHGRPSASRSSSGAPSPSTGRASSDRATGIDDRSTVTCWRSTTRARSTGRVRVLRGRLGRRPCAALDSF